MSNNQLTVADITVRQDDAGRYNLNDLHRAAGGEPRHRPSLWLENKQTRELIDELEGEAGNPALVSLHGGRSPGTFSCKELVYAYATWISPKFYLKVIRAYDQLQTEGVAVSESAAGDLLTSEPFTSSYLFFTSNIHTILADSW